jgi:hypothetical protein
MKVIICLMGIMIFAHGIAMELEHSGSDGCRKSSRALRNSFDLYGPEVTDKSEFNRLTKDEKWHLINQFRKSDLEKEREVRDLKKQVGDLKKQSNQKAPWWKIVVTTMFCTFCAVTFLQQKILSCDK